MLRRDEEGGAGSDSEPPGELAGRRRRRRRLQETAYWVGLLLLAVTMGLFLAFTLPERSQAEKRERDIVATVSAEKTAISASTATAAAELTAPQ